MTVLAGGGGFILTSLLWATTLTHLIDGRIRPAALVLMLAGVLAFFGVMHSPLSSAPLAMPGEVIARLEADGHAAATAGQTPYHWSAAYVLAAVALLALGRFGQPPPPRQDDPLPGHPVA